jgi:VWFA-related protein
MPMTMMRKSCFGLHFLLWVSGAALLQTTAWGQETPADTFGATVEVELVNVEVRVLNRDGEPVTGLTAGDFEVLHDGSPVSISNFSEFRQGVVVRGDEGDSASPMTAEGVVAEHHVVVYFDDLHLRATHRGVLIGALRDFIASRQVPSENIMILRQGRELNIQAPFGSSSQDLEEALRALEEAPPGLSHENAVQQALDEIQRTWNQSRDATGSGEQQVAQIPGSNLGTGGGGGPGNGGTSPRDVTGSAGSLSSGLVPSACDMFKSRVEGILNGWMQQRTNQISVTLASLSDSATYLAGLPGVKSVLYLSDALETMPGLALSNYADTICPGGAQNLAMNNLGEQLGGAFINLSRHAAANRVTFYAVQGGGLQVSSSGSARDTGVRAGSVASFEASRRAGDQSGLILLAEETGGRAVLNQNDYERALQEVGREMLNFYSLAYQSPTGGDRANHRIEVRLREPGLEVRYRQGYLQKSVTERFAESIQGALYLGLVDNPLEARLGAGEFRSAGEGSVILPLRVILPVEMISFVPAGETLTAAILIRVVARDIESGEVHRKDQNFQVKHDPDSGGEWMQLPVELQLNAGPHMFVVGVLDQESGLASTVSTTLEVPSL